MDPENVSDRSWTDYTSYDRKTYGNNYLDNDFYDDLYDNSETKEEKEERERQINKDRADALRYSRRLKDLISQEEKENAEKNRFASSSDVWMLGVPKDGVIIYFTFLETIETLKKDNKLKMDANEEYSLPHPFLRDKTIKASDFVKLNDPLVPNAWHKVEVLDGMVHEYILTHSPGH